MENQYLTQKNKSVQTIKFKNNSFPQVTLQCSENLIFHYSTNLYQSILELFKNEIDKNIIVEKLIEGFNNENTNINLINILKEKANFENQRLNDIKEIYKPLFKYDFKKKTPLILLIS